MTSRVEYRAELQNLRSQRDRLASQLSQVDLTIGRVARSYLQQESTSYSSAARLLGVSHTHVKALIERASDELSPPRDPEWLVPVMSPWHAVNHLRITERTISRVIAGFEKSDVFHASRLDPRSFEQGDGWALNVPNMLWRLDDESWIGIDDVNVGYGGTGGANALRTLQDAGLEHDLAQQIADARFSETDVVTGAIDKTRIWPRYEVGLPELAGDRLIVQIGQDDLMTREPSLDETGFYPSLSGRSVLLEWMNYLDKERPTWADGPRTARVFLDRDSAVNQGFVRRPSGLFGGGGSPFTIIIEQGQLQLWIETYEPQDPTQHLSEETYEVLSDADMYPRELAGYDSRSKFWRVLHKQFGPDRPKWIDLSDTGAATLSYVPSDVASAATES